MRTVRVIPCLDVADGRVVKGVQFVDLVDAGDPVELAARYDAEGADELVFLDITASSDARNIMADVVARTARKVFIPLTVGGGIRSIADARRILMSGADKVSVNTAAVRRPGHAAGLGVQQPRQPGGIREDVDGHRAKPKDERGLVVQQPRLPSGRADDGEHDAGAEDAGGEQQGYRAEEAQQRRGRALAPVGGTPGVVAEEPVGNRSGLERDRPE